MKMAKRETKYIIRRIIIGVAVALILANIKACKVYAVSLPTVCIEQNNQYINEPISCNRDNYSSSLINIKTYGFNFFSHNVELSTTTTYAFYNQTENYYSIYYNDWRNVNYYKKYRFKKNVDDNNYTLYNYDNNFSTTFKTQSNRVFITDSATTYDNLLSKIDTNNTNVLSKTLMLGNKMIYFIYSMDGSPISSLSLDFSLIDNTYNKMFFNAENSPQEDFTYEYNNEIYTYEKISIADIVPSNYSKIEFNNNEAVIFVPKNYSSVPQHTDNNNIYIDFNMYYQGTIRESYFNILDTSDWYFKKQEDLLSFQLEEYSTTFPMFFDNDETNGKYTALMFNKTESSTDVIIYYDTRYYNYYFIESLDSTALIDISYIDKNGNETIATISFISTIEDYWLEGFDTGGDSFSDSTCSNNGFCTDNIESIISFLKLPFNWLKSLNRNSCSTISIPFPYTDRNITINCLSSTFINILGQNFYNLILYIISGIIAYRITLRNIDCITDCLDPQDDKLEVVDL